MSTDVDLILQPNAERNRSMVLYAQRLAEQAPPGCRWRVRRLPSLPGNIGYRVAEMLLAPMALRLPGATVQHIVDHAHAAYVRHTRARTVVTVHDLIPLKWLRGEYTTDTRMPRAAATWFRHNIAALQHANRLVCPSRATATELERLLGLPADVIPNGIDNLFFRPPEPAATSRIEQRLARWDGPLLLQVSNGFFYKNDAAFAAVFRQLSNALPTLGWVRVGSPLSAALRRQLGKQSLTDRLFEIGAATAHDVAALYRRCDCLLFPSWDEGFGWPPLEAMAAGCPVVCSTGGALAETAAPGALVAAPDDIGTLAEHVRSVLTEPETAQALRRRGAAQAKTYMWSTSAKKLAAVYEALQ